ncbi:hypothetical protein CW707_03510 [Candidatus Bathyarchaeota archaeon]|nr:MAG: hypothetical protein CW667_00480 [Candidatus Bathyarchaeota archaeon]RJS81446.1 MAG: hypothetical protein CW707_03510 [Candidatus Bathyarchaeota archaeon]RLI18678.1 MAG: hypothetical protein DRO44_00495 [Candidatus Bathyarchaeota archaeon]
METEQETSEEPYYEEENQENLQSPQQNTAETPEETYAVAEEEQPQQITIEPKPFKLNNQEDRSGFVHGLSVGLGIGCIATFIVMWVSIFFTPMLPTTITYEAMLSVFIYPLIYLLAVGLIALTAGIVREYYARKGNI